MTHIELGLVGNGSEESLYPTRLPEVSDLEQARALLAASGHKILDGGVVRDKDGHHIELEVDPDLEPQDKDVLKSVGFTMLDGALH